MHVAVITFTSRSVVRCPVFFRRGWGCFTAASPSWFGIYFGRRATHQRWAGDAAPFMSATPELTLANHPRAALSGELFYIIPHADYGCAKVTIASCHSGFERRGIWRARHQRKMKAAFLSR